MRTAMAALAGALVAGLATAPSAAERQGHQDGPPTVTGADLTFRHPSRTLQHGTAREAGLVREYVDRPDH